MHPAPTFPDLFVRILHKIAAEETIYSLNYREVYLLVFAFDQESNEDNVEKTVVEL